jgi:ribose 5-phosphate isomerase
MEQTLNHIPGVVENGLFSSRTADIVLVAETETVSVFSSLKGEQKEEP